jgi:type IV pilus assembly protein PilC
MKKSHLSLSGKDKLTLISDLATMLSAGIPILESVESILEGSKGNQKKILLNLKKDLEQGMKISDSFAKSPKAFDPVTVNLIRAAEEAGTLDTTLKDIIVNIKKDIEFSDKVKGALAYPMVVFFVFAVVVVTILVFVIPRIGKVFSQIKIELPLPTRILIALSDFILNYTIFIIAFVVLSIIGLVMLYKSKKIFFLNLVFSLPLVSTLIKQIDFTRFSRSMALLLSSGIPVTEALELSQNVIVKKEIIRVIKIATEKLSSGKPLSETFREHKKVIPGIMMRITAAGEKTGTLDKSMQEVTEYFDYQTSNTLKTLTTLLEPIMLVIMGFLVGGVMLSIVAPIYGLISQITPH